ncbi:hypothetical protein [Tellurirhabdus rosea]|uniref:hypothetical protein n=1 Tax=Tellurirhabdus rosea TaxID=2674997 RepID=UPI0022515914|nr:hypothetical protein [Tellurirhabdus rosea]
MKKFTAFLLFICLFAHLTNAQRRSPAPSRETGYDKPASVSVRVGPTLLFGDLKESRSAWTAGAQLTLPVSRMLSVGLAGDLGRLRGEESAFYHARSDCRFGQGTLVGMLDLLQLGKEKARLSEFNLYGGVGLILFNAKAYDLTTDQLLRLTNNENSFRSRDGIEQRGRRGIRNTHELSVPVGVRFSSPLSRRLSVTGDIRYTFVRTDKLDATLDNNNLTLKDGRAQTEQILYSQNTHDRFGALSVGVVYYFGERQKND